MNTARNTSTARSLIEAMTNADWAIDRETRQSTSCALIFVNGNVVYFHAKKQKATTLSSCEGELVAAVGGLSEGVFLQNLLERVLKIKPDLRILEQRPSDHLEKTTWKNEAYRCWFAVDSKLTSVGLLVKTTSLILDIGKLRGGSRIARGGMPTGYRGTGFKSNCDAMASLSAAKKQAATASSEVFRGQSCRLRSS